MPTTITTYNTFVADTKARATEVNQNFNNYRGDILPINIDTASASNDTHDLGSTDHVWAQSHITEVQLTPFTTGATVKLTANSADTAGAMDIKIADSTAAVVYPEGVFNLRSFATPGVTATFGQIGRSLTISGQTSGAFAGNQTLAVVNFQSRGNPIRVGFTNAIPGTDSPTIGGVMRTSVSVAAYIFHFRTVDSSLAATNVYNWRETLQTTGDEDFQASRINFLLPLAAGNHRLEVLSSSSGAFSIQHINSVFLETYEI